jgi:hypothetical protein
MNKLRRAGRALLDLLAISVRHPLWSVSAWLRKAAEIRAEGKSTFVYSLPRIYHHQLDPRLERLDVEIGGASSTDYDKAVIVARFCRLIQPSQVLEIGTFRGGMTYHIARNTPPACTIYTLDLPRSELVQEMVASMIDTDVKLATIPQASVGIEWRDSPEAQKITQLWGDSYTFDYTGLGPFGVIYIDGSHAERWVRRDTENALRLLAPTGAILWDDCYWSDVARVLGDFSSTVPIYLCEDRSTACFFRLNGEPVTIAVASF